MFQKLKFFFFTNKLMMIFMMIAIWIGASAIQSYYYYNNREYQEQQENQKYLEFLQSSYDSCLENHFIFNNKVYDESHHKQCVKQLTFLVKETWKKGTLTFNAPSDNVSFTLKKSDYPDERTIIRNEITFAHRSKINIITEEKVTPRPDQYICNSFFSACDTKNLEKAYKEDKLSNYLQYTAWQRSRFVIFFGLFLFLIYKYFRSSHNTWKENYTKVQEAKERYQNQVSRIRSSSQSLRLQSMELQKQLRDENVKMSQLKQGLEAAKLYIDQKDQEILALTNENTKRIERLEQIIQESQQEHRLLLEDKQKQERNLKTSQQQLLLLTDSSRQSQEMKALLRLKEELTQQYAQLEQTKIQEKAKAQKEIKKLLEQKSQLEQSSSLNKQQLAQLEAEIKKQKQIAEVAIANKQAKIAQLEGDYQKLQAASNTVTRQNLQKIQDLKDEIKQGKESLQDLSHRVAQLEEAKNHAKEDLRKAHDEKERLNQRIEQLNQEKIDLENQKQEIFRQNQLLDTQIRKTQRDLETIQQQLHNKETEIKELRHDLSKSIGDKHELEKLRQNERDWEEFRQLYEDEIKTLENKLENKNDEHQKKINEYKSEIAQYVVEIEQLQKQLIQNPNLDKKQCADVFLTKFKLKKSSSEFNSNLGKHHSKDFVAEVFNLLKSLQDLNLVDKVTATAYRPRNSATLSLEQKNNVDKRYYLVVTSEKGTGYSAEILLTAKNNVEAIIQAQIIRMLVKNWENWTLNIKL